MMPGEFEFDFVGLAQGLATLGTEMPPVQIKPDPRIALLPTFNYGPFTLTERVTAVMADAAMKQMSVSGDFAKVPR